MKSSVLQQPLLHFALLGAALFGLYGLVGKETKNPPDKIVISSARMANLADGFARIWRRQPTQEELDNLVADDIRDEVFYREGRAAGLDRDDVIIRRRVRQKMEFLAENMSAPDPTEEQLASYLASNPERFRTSDRITFRQIFLSAKRGNTIENDSQEIVKVLTGADATADVATLGDPFLLGDDFKDLPQNEVASMFSEDFSKRIAVLNNGRWHGPIPSSFGQHFLFISERIPGSVPPLDNVRQAVRREWENARRVEAEQKLYASLRERYEIVIEKSPTKASLADSRR